MSAIAFYRKFSAFVLSILYFFNLSFSVLLPKTETAEVNGSLVTVDELGRSVVSAGTSKKKVGLFYFLVLGNHGTDGPFDNTKIVEGNPDAVLSDENWIKAGGGPVLTNHFWGEPLFGYYIERDAWVIRKHLQMLTDAGIDFIVFDTTNTVIYPAEVETLLDIWYEYYLQGWNVPKLAFYTNTNSGDTMNRIYDSFYNNGTLKSKYPRLDELWFRIDEGKNAKPMIIGDSSDPVLRDDVKDFFRIKANQWPFEDKKADGFPWVEFNKRNLTLSAKYKGSLFDKSIASVSAAQHCDTVHFSATAWYGGTDHSRSWHDGVVETGEDAVKYGYNFQEQWDFVNKLDPDIAFVTGWNEWIAVRGISPVESEPILFCDAADTECSRDLEPSAGKLGDNYYMQLVANVAHFKGKTASLKTGDKVTIDIDGDFSQWDSESITAIYRDYKNDTVDRDCAGYGSLWYSDDSGRNDIVNSKVAYDDSFIYFYVDTADTLTDPNGGAWMTLFVNTNGTKEGYDFVINRTAPENGKTTIEAVTESGYEKIAEADIRFSGNRLMIRVAAGALGLTGAPSFSFKWADNYVDGDIYSFYTKGDAAPYGRLNYSFGK